jgi:hypothetical protein
MYLYFLLIDERQTVKKPFKRSRQKKCINIFLTEESEKFVRTFVMSSYIRATSPRKEIAGKRQGTSQNI